MSKKSRPLGWTTLEESKKLLEAGLSPDTADMWYAERNPKKIEGWNLIQNGDAVEDYKFWSQRLLDLAKKQLQPDIDKEIDNAYKTRDEVVYFEGYEKGKEDALKEKNFVDINKGK